MSCGGLSLAADLVLLDKELLKAALMKQRQEIQLDDPAAVCIKFENARAKSDQPLKSSPLVAMTF